MGEPARGTRQPKQSGSRTRIYVLASIVFLVLGMIATQLFLHRTSVGSPKFPNMTFLLWSATILVGVALLILATVLGRNLIKLYFERKSGQVGSGFKTKMVRTFVALSLLPALLLFFLANRLIESSIEQWFSAPAEQMLGYSRSMAFQYYDETEQRNSRFAAQIAASILPEEVSNPESHPRLEQKLAEQLHRYDLGAIQVFGPRGGFVAGAGRRKDPETHRAEVRDLIAQTLAGRAGFEVKRSTPGDALKELAWATAALRTHEGNMFGAVLTEIAIPQSMNFKANSVMEAYRAYAQLQSEKQKLRFNFFLVLALSTLLIVFAFSWFAMYLAKRITTPIQALAEGAAAVAVGDLDYRVECEAFDELESLVVSFNRMTGELKENKAHIEAAQASLKQSMVELDNRRRYIETILQTIATGVMSLDSGYRIRTMNRAAYQMLQVQPAAGDVPLEEVVRGSAGETLKVLLRKSAVLGPVVRNIELNLPGKTLHLATTATPLLDGTGQQTGWVVVLDDVTELLRMEKLSAWQEVARRLAHEIKNPLTPIQLSAERMMRRYRQLLPAADVESTRLGSWQEAFASFDNLMEECVRTITQEAHSLKNLVDEFSRFARLPQARLEDADIHRVLENTLNLYNGRIQDVRLQKEFSPDVPTLRLDPEQMKRVFINIFDNALEAMAESPNPKILHIRTSCNTPQCSVRVEVSDTGRGFPKEYQDSLFLPYFSTRNGGTGLGLAIVRQIISEHYGQIRAEPSSPLGTRIIIDLPLSPA
jgi:two-component system nitrogen regulation sensor histidine kinase NtrY